jgi:hypothetical protein
VIAAPLKGLPSALVTRPAIAAVVFCANAGAAATIATATHNAVLEKIENSDLLFIPELLKMMSTC